MKRSERRARDKPRNVALYARHLRLYIRGVVCTCHIFGMLQVSSSTESRADRRYRQDSSNTPASTITVGDCHIQAPLASSVVASAVDTALFFSLAFAFTGLPWITWAVGDFGVKVAVALVMLLPFRLLMPSVRAA